MPKKKKSDYMKALEVKSPIKGLSSKDSPLRKKKKFGPPSIFKKRIY